MIREPMTPQAHRYLPMEQVTDWGQYMTIGNMFMGFLGTIVILILISEYWAENEL